MGVQSINNYFTKGKESETHTELAQQMQEMKLEKVRVFSDQKKYLVGSSHAVTSCKVLAWQLQPKRAAPTSPTKTPFLTASALKSAQRRYR
jgi:hypothetical protein